MPITLREARELKGWTLEVLAEKSGLKASTLSRLERGETEPLWSTANAIEEALGLKRGALDFNPQTAAWWWDWSEGDE